MSFRCYELLHNLEYLGLVIQDIDIPTRVNYFRAGVALSIPIHKQNVYWCVCVCLSLPIPVSYKQNTCTQQRLTFLVVMDLTDCLALSVSLL